MFTQLLEFRMSHHKGYPTNWLVCTHVVVTSQGLHSEAETACQNWGGSAFMKWWCCYVHSEYIWHSLHDNLQPFFMTTSSFEGGGGGSAPTYQAQEIKCREGLRMLLLLHAIIPYLHTCMNCNSSLW